MNSFATYREIVQSELMKLHEELQPPSLKEQINYFLSLGGKRLRPSLVLAGCDLFEGDLTKAVRPALGIELFHNFTLIHDDVMDEAPLRRNRQTLHKKWNLSSAILAGDAMYASSFDFVTTVEDEILRSVINLFCKTAIQVCEGQQLDMIYEDRENISVDDYLKMIELKTAVLLACSLQLGAMIGKGKEQDISNLYEFGRNAGIAFQLKDDILDVYGEQEKFGKQVAGDIVAGKKTFLHLKALELSTPYESKILQNNSAEADYVKEVILVYDKYNVKEAALDQINVYYKKAIENLNNIDVKKNKLQLLVEFADNIIKREN